MTWERTPEWMREALERAHAVEQQAIALAATLIGAQEVEAEARIEESGFEMRIASRDGQRFALRADRRWNRINLTIVAGTVTNAEVF